MLCGVYWVLRKPVFKLFWLLLCVLILEGCGQRQGGQTPESPNQETLSYEIGDAEVTITGCSVFTKGELVIPEQIEGLPVTSIRDSAFTGCRSLTSITIPDSVTSIGDLAFSRCTNLTSITIPDSVTSIGDHTFTFCTSLTSIAIAASITSIGDGAFLDCNSLTSISIPQAFHSEAEASLLGLDGLWLDGFALPDSSSN